MKADLPPRGGSEGRAETRGSGQASRQARGGCWKECGVKEMRARKVDVEHCRSDPTRRLRRHCPALTLRAFVASIDKSLSIDRLRRPLLTPSRGRETPACGLIPYPDPDTFAIAAGHPPAMAPISAADPSPHAPPVSTVVSAIVPPVRATVVDKLHVGLAVFTIEDRRLGLVELIENSTAIRNPGKRAAGPRNT